jgi:hypothetical protein
MYLGGLRRSSRCQPRPYSGPSLPLTSIHLTAWKTFYLDGVTLKEQGSGGPRRGSS